MFQLVSIMLTDEDKKRIEANRLRAIELRAKKQSLATNNSSVPSIPFEPIKKYGEAGSSNNTITGKFGSETIPNSTNTAQWYRQKTGKDSQNSSSTVKCVLISKERFEAVCNYSALLIGIFKSIETCSYGKQLQ